MRFAPDYCSSAASFLLARHKSSGTITNTDFLLRWEQTNFLPGLSYNIHMLRSVLDFHIMFITLHLLLSFSGFVPGCFVEFFRSSLIFSL